MLQAYEAQLAQQLRGRGITPEAVARITMDVMKRLQSLLSHWHNPLFLEPLLVIAVEQAVNWEPRWVKPEVRALVALCIRNSEIEEYHTTAGGRRQMISEEDMRRITRQALRYFGPLDLVALAAHTTPVDAAEDVFGRLPEQFALAWQALSTLAFLPPHQQESRFAAARGSFPRKFLFGEPDSGQNGPLRTGIVSGMDPRFESGLVTYLFDIWERNAPFYFSDSFKGISRRPEKLLAVIDFVLSCNVPLVTQNYFLQNGYVARRLSLLAPAHKTSDMHKNLGNTNGLTAEHERLLDKIRQSLQSAPRPMRQ